MLLCTFNFELCTILQPFLQQSDATRVDKVTNLQQTPLTTCSAAALRHPVGRRVGESLNQIHATVDRRTEHPPLRQVRIPIPSPICGQPTLWSESCLVA